MARLARRLGALSRRGLLAGTAVVGSALAVDPRGYVLTPRAAYSTICGPGNTAAQRLDSVFCCTVNKGVNACPPGTFAAGWWKAADSSWCGGGYRYFIDCNAKCSKCSSGCAGDHICDRTCWNCSCGHGLDGHLRPATALLQRVPLRPVQHPGQVQRWRRTAGW